jgi:iron complex transport system ATP-binding protein
MSLAAQALAFGYPGRVVGRGLDLSLGAGEVVCVLGPNGAGKTTLFRTLLGLIPPLGGRVTVAGADVAALPRVEMARKLAYVPQAMTGAFDFTLLDIVEMGRTAHLGAFARPSRHDLDLALAALERLGIASLAGRPMGAVSGGERQLALIARALATEATHLLMDEPTANLDFGNQALILDEVARLKACGAAVLFSTHHPDHALRIADRVVMLRGGAVLAAGATSATLNSENLSALYGRPIDVLEVVSPDGTSRRTCVARESPPLN